jgi:hypothetical protein
MHAHLFGRSAPKLVVAVLLGLTLAAASPAARADERPLKLAVFQADVTPPVGSPVAYAPTRTIEDPLSARGIVLLGSDAPIVLCAVDWIGIANEAHDAWRKALADAAGTTPDRVAVHVLHQHDAPLCDFAAAQLLAPHGLADRQFDVAFARQALERTAAAVAEAVRRPRNVTHLGVGQARVEKVASNRRILGPDGKVAIVRYSASRIAEAIAAPEGVIDPVLRCVSFWDGQRPIVCLTYYATHPQSYYGKGDVTAEFVGLARAEREKNLDGLVHVHFNGAGGNVAAGKYNDGSPQMRPILMQRLAEGMHKAWEGTERVPLTAADLEWRTTAVRLPAAEYLDADQLAKTVADQSADPAQRIAAARNLVFLRRVQAGVATELACLRLKHVHVLHMPGELFVEYQLAAQAMRPDAVVCMAAYGDYGAGYIGTEISYSQGGYETSPRSTNVAPQVERVLTDAMRELLK